MTGLGSPSPSDVLFCAVLCRAVPCCAVLCRAVPCRAVPCCAVPYFAVLGCAALCSAVLCCTCYPASLLHLVYAFRIEDLKANARYNQLEARL